MPASIFSAGAGQHGTVIRGLAITHLGGRAVAILVGSDNDVIAGNFIGTDVSGATFSFSAPPTILIAAWERP
jgi:hypothetical protein